MAGNFTVYWEFIARDRYSKVAKRIDASTKLMNRRLEKASLRLKLIGKSISGAGRSMSIFSAIIGATGYKALSLFNKQAVAVEQVRIGLESTAKVSGKTLAELTEQAKRLQSETLFGDETILAGVTSQLLTFTNIAGKEFDRTQQAVLDVGTRLAAARGGFVDLTATSIMLGKALNDPIANLGALGRSGIQFNESQKKVIKYLWKTGQRAKAQSIILSELEKQYGGSAKAAADVGTGAFTKLFNQVGDLLEVFGELTNEVLKPHIETIKDLNSKVQKLSPTTKKIIVYFGIFATLLGPALIALGFMAQGFGVLTTAIRVLSFKAIIPLFKLLFMNPFGLIILAIALVTYGVIKMIKHWDKVKPVLLKVWNIFKKFAKFTPFGIFIKAGELIYQNWDKIKNLFIVIKEKIAGFVDKLKPAISWIAKIPFFGGEAPTIKPPMATEMDRVLSRKSKGDKSTFEGTLNIAGAPKGSTLQTATTGAMNMNVGLNMEGAY